MNAARSLARDFIYPCSVDGVYSAFDEDAVGVAGGDSVEASKGESDGNHDSGNDVGGLGGHLVGPFSFGHPIHCSSL